MRESEQHWLECHLPRIPIFKELTVVDQLAIHPTKYQVLCETYLSKLFLNPHNNPQSRYQRHYFLFLATPWCLYGISAPWPGIESRPWQWKPRILTTRPPRNSLNNTILQTKTLAPKILKNYRISWRTRQGTQSVVGRQGFELTFVQTQRLGSFYQITAILPEGWQGQWLMSWMAEMACGQPVRSCWTPATNTLVFFQGTSKSACALLVLPLSGAGNFTIPRT